MSLLQRALAPLSLLFFINTQAALAESSVKVTDRLYLASDDAGELTVSNRYLTNYVMRGVDPATGELGSMHFIRPSTRAIDFDVVDVEFDGIVPKTDLRFPAKAPEETKIDLTKYRFLEGGDWRNADIVFQGASLVDMSHTISSGSLTKTEQIDTLVLFALNALTLTQTSISVVHDLESAGVESAGELVSKLQPLAEKVANYQDEITKLGFLSDISQVWLDIGDRFLGALGQDLSVYPGLADFRQYHSVFNESLSQLKVVAGITTDITAGREAEVKGRIADQYRRLLKDLPGDLSSTSVEVLLDLAADEFAGQYTAATTDRERAELMALYFIQPMEKTLVLFKNEYQRQLKQLKSDNAPESQIEAKQEEIDYLRNGRAILLLSNMAFNAPEVMRKVYEEPEFVIPFLWELGAAVAGEVFTLENTETVVKQAWQQYTKLDGRHGSFVKIRKVFKNAGSYMKAVSAGSTIGNRLLPLVWDIVLAPNRLQTSLVNGQFSPYGPMETLVGVAKIDPVTGEERLIGGVNQENDKVSLALSVGDNIRIKTGLRRPWQFDPSRAPWDLNPSVVPSTVYDVLVTSPDTYAHTYLCARKLLGNTDYALYETVGANWRIPPQQCGVGVSDTDLLGFQFPSTGGDWYNGRKENSTTYNPGDLPSRLKIAEFTTKTAPLNVLDYQYQGGRESLQVIVSGLSTNSIVHDITLVPELEQVGFQMSQMAGENDAVIATFDASQILAAPEDPIASYSWTWGDSGIVSVSTEPTIQHEYSRPGSYQVSLDVTTESGAVTRYEEDIAVGLVDTPVLSVTPGDNTLVLDWNSVPNADSYNLYYAKESMGTPADVDNYAAYNGGIMLPGISGNTYTYTLNTLVNDTTYYLAVTAVENGIESIPSNEVSATPRAPVVASAPLNDTGITWSSFYSNPCIGGTASQQDCSYGRDAEAAAGTLTKVGGGAAGFDFSRINADGSEYNGSGDYALEPWACVRDNHSGLMWEVKTNDGSLHATGNSYTWYNPDGNTNGGNSGTQNGGSCVGTQCDTNSYVQAVNQKNLCGASDWRMPTVDELHSIAHLGRTSPAIDSDYFPYSRTIPYWSASSFAGNSDAAGVVRFSDGRAFWTSKSYKRPIRLVRGGE